MKKKTNEIALTEAEQRIILWIRRNSHGKNWTGTINFVSGPNVYMLADHKPAGRINGRYKGNP